LPTAPRKFTDPESRILPASDAKGSFIQGYNCHAAVDATAQIIVATDVTNEPNDKQHAQPLLPPGARQYRSGASDGESGGGRLQ
jgi:hypothetical protein